MADGKASAVLHAWSAGILVGSAVLCALAGLAPAARAQQSVVVRVVDTGLEFGADTTVVVDVAVDRAQGVAGLEFVLEYSVDRLAGPDQLSTHEAGTVTFDLVVVNHAYAYDPVQRLRRIKWAGAAAEGLTQKNGTLTRFSFPVTCAGYAQDHPEGRQVELRVVEAVAYDEQGGTRAVSTFDGTLDLNCTGASVDDGPTFGTLKARFAADPSFSAPGGE